MKFLPILSLVAFSLLLTTSAFSQDKYEIKFKHNTIIPERNISEFDLTQFDASQRMNNGVYTFLQFDNTPTDAEFNAIIQTGIQLLEYIPNKTYLAFVPNIITNAQLISVGVRAVVPIESEHKTSSIYYRNTIP